MCESKREEMIRGNKSCIYSGADAAGDGAAALKLHPYRNRFGNRKARLNLRAVEPPGETLSKISL